MADVLTQILAAFNLDGVSAWQITAGVAILATALGFKAMDLGKRGIRKV